MDGIVRKPIIIDFLRRSEYNPEFLDVDFLLEKYVPLFKSICRHFCSYAGILDNSDDIEDLYNQIQLEFVKLVRRYDPRRGVDFPGYIKFNLQNRVYYWVTRLQKVQNTEKLVLSDDEDEDIELDIVDLNHIKSYYNEVDSSSDQEKFRIEAIMCIPWEKLNEVDKDMVIDVLNHFSLEDIARKRHTTIQAVRADFDRVCDLLIDCYKGRDNECSENTTIENSGA